MTRLALDTVAKDQFNANIFTVNDISEIADKEKLYRAYESGWPVVIRGLTVEGIDYDYYDDLPDWVIPGNKWIAPWYNSDIKKRDRMRSERNWTEEQIDEFHRQHKQSNKAWNNFFSTLLPRYQEAQNKTLSHRYNMLVENMLHFDELTDDHSGIDQQIRMFTNLDKKRPRVLTFGMDLVQLWHTYKDSHNLEELDKNDAHSFVSDMRDRLIWNKENWALFHHPLHYITLDPGDIWMFNAQWLSHQLVFGAKLQLFEADIPQDLLVSPELCLSNRILNIENEVPFGFDK